MFRYNQKRGKDESNKQPESSHRTDELDPSEVLEKVLLDANFTISWRKKEIEYNKLKKDLKECKLILFMSVMQLGKLLLIIKNQ